MIHGALEEESNPPLSKISARSSFHFKSHQYLAVLRPHRTGVVSVHLFISLSREDRRCDKGYIRGVIRIDRDYCEEKIGGVSLLS